MKNTYSSINPFPLANGYDGADEVELPACIWLFGSFQLAMMHIWSGLYPSFYTFVNTSMFRVLGFTTNRGEGHAVLSHMARTHKISHDTYVSHPVLVLSFLSDIGRRCRTFLESTHVSGSLLFCLFYTLVKFHTNQTSVFSIYPTPECAQARTSMMSVSYMVRLVRTCGSATY